MHALHELVDAGVEERVGARVEVELEVHDEAKPPVRSVVAFHAHRHEGLLLRERIGGLRATVRTRLSPKHYQPMECTRKSANFFEHQQKEHLIGLTEADDDH